MPTTLYNILLLKYRERYCVPPEQEDAFLVAESMGYIRCMMELANDEQKKELTKIFDLSAILLVGLSL